MKHTWLKKILIFLGVALAAGVVGLLLFNFCFPNHWVKGIIQKTASGMLNGRMTIRDLHVKPFSSVSLSGLEVQDASGIPVFTLDSLRLSYRILALVSGTLDIRELALVRPRFHACRRDSQWNFLTLLKPDTSQKPDTVEKKSPMIDSILETQIPLNVHLGRFSITDFGVKAEIPETLAFSGLDLSLEDLNLKRISGINLALDISLKDTISMEMPLKPDRRLSVKVPFDFNSNVQIKKLLNTDQQMQLIFKGLWVSIQDPKGREETGLSMDLGIDHHLSVKGKTAAERLSVRLSDLRVRGQVRGALDSADFLVLLKAPFSLSPKLEIGRIALDSIRICVAGERLISAQGWVTGLPADPVVELKLLESAFSLQPLIAGFQSLLPVKVAGSVDLGGTWFNLHPLQVMAQTKAHLQLKVRSLSVRRTPLVLSGLQTEIEADFKITDGKPDLALRSNARGHLPGTNFVLEIKAGVPARLQDLTLVAVLDVPAMSLDSVLPPDAGITGQGRVKNSFSIRGLNHINNEMLFHAANFRLKKTMKRALPALRIKQTMAVGLQGFQARGWKVDPRMFRKIGLNLDSLLVVVNDGIRVNARGSVQNQGLGVLRLKTEIAVENAAVSTLLPAFLEPDLVRHLKGGEAIALDFDGRLKQPMKTGVVNGRMTLPFAGEFSMGIDVNDAGGRIRSDTGLSLRSADGKIHLQVSSNDTAFNSQFSCRFKMDALAGPGLPLPEIRGTYFNCELIFRDGSDIEVRDLEGGAGNVPVALTLNGRAGHLFSNPVSDIKGNLRFNSPSSFALATGPRLSGEAGFDFGVDLPSLNAKLLDFKGMLYFKDFEIRRDTSLQAGKINGRVRCQQRVDFSGVDPKALSGIPKIRLAALGDFREDPVKQLNYREVDKLYQTDGAAQGISIRRIALHGKKDYVVDSVRAEVNFENNTLSMSRLEIKTFNGTFTGRARIHYSDGRLYVLDSLLKSLEYSVSCQMNGFNYDWFERGAQDSGYYRGRNYEIDLIFNMDGRDVSDLKNLNFSGNLDMPFLGPRIAKTFFRTYIDPENKMKIMSAINGALSQGAHIDNVNFGIANGRFGVNIKFWPVGNCEVPRRNPLSNVMEMVLLRINSQ